MNINENDKLLNTLKQRKTTPSLVAEILRNAILHGELKGGEQLRQAEIAEQFGMSRIPVREALRQLEAEGLVTFAPHRGATVSILSAKEVREIYEIRMLLEIGAMRFALPCLTEKDLLKAEKVIEQIDREENSSKWTELNWKFHSTLYSAADRPRLMAMINNLHTNVAPYMRIYLSLMNYQRKSQEEHRQILEACKKKDESAAIEAIEKHLSTARELLVDYLDQKAQMQKAKERDK